MEEDSRYKQSGQLKRPFEENPPTFGHGKRLKLPEPAVPSRPPYTTKTACDLTSATVENNWHSFRQRPTPMNKDFPSIVPEALRGMKMIVVNMETVPLAESFMIKSLKAVDTGSGQVVYHSSIVPVHARPEDLERLGFFELGDKSWILSLPEENRAAISEAKLLCQILRLTKSHGTCYRIVFPTSDMFMKFRILAKRNKLWANFMTSLIGWVDLKHVLHAQFVSPNKKFLKAFSSDTKSLISMTDLSGRDKFNSDTDQSVMEALATPSVRTIESDTQPLETKLSSVISVVALHLHTISYGSNASNQTKCITQMFMFSQISSNQLNIAIEPHGPYSKEKASKIGYKECQHSGKWTLNNQPCVTTYDAITKIIQFLEAETKKNQRVLLYTMCESEVLIPLFRLFQFHCQLEKLIELIEGMADAATILQNQVKRSYANSTQVLKYYQNMKGAKYPQDVENCNVFKIAKMGLDLLRLLQKDEKNKLRPLSANARSWTSPELNELLLQNEVEVPEFQEYAGVLKCLSKRLDFTANRSQSVQVKLEQIMTDPHETLWVIPHPLSGMRFKPVKFQVPETGIVTDIDITFSSFELNNPLNNVQFGIVLRHSALQHFVSLSRQPQKKISEPEKPTDDEKQKIEIRNIPLPLPKPVPVTSPKTEPRQHLEDVKPKADIKYLPMPLASKIIPKIEPGTQINPPNPLKRRLGEPTRQINKTDFERLDSGLSSEGESEATTSDIPENSNDFLIKSATTRQLSSKDEQDKNISDKVESSSNETHAQGAEDEIKTFVVNDKGEMEAEDQGNDGKMTSENNIETNEIEIHLKTDSTLDENIEVNTETIKADDNDDVDLSKYLLLSEFQGHKELMITLEKWHRAQGLDADNFVGDDLIATLAGLGHIDNNDFEEALKSFDGTWTLRKVEDCLKESFPVLPVVLDEKWSLFVGLQFFHMKNKQES